jgi:hypothetical protein
VSLVLSVSLPWNTPHTNTLSLSYDTNPSMTRRQRDAKNNKGQAFIDSYSIAPGNV